MEQHDGRSRATSSSSSRKLKDETDGSILVAGSGTLVETLLGADLVDELRLMVFPTILGRGRRVFPDGIDRLKFTLVGEPDGRAGRRAGSGAPTG